jgi:hypothetical protein
VAISWWAEAGEAWAADADGAILWHGVVGGPRVLDALSIPGEDDGIIVLDWSSRPPDVQSWHPYANLLRVRPNGEVVWQASAPKSETLGCWTGAGFSEGRLCATGWASVSELDAATGEVRSTEFTK